MAKSPDQSDLPPTGSRSIYTGLRAQILEGAYPPGALLPSTRSLALDLGVARSTITTAFEQLLAEGYIESRQGARARVVQTPATPAASAIAAGENLAAPRLSRFGQRVAALPMRYSPPQKGLAADFRYGDLSPTEFPAQVWKQAIVAATLQRPERLAYGDPCGLPRLRDALCAYLWRARGIRCDPAQIIVTSGSQQALDLTARILLDAGGRFAIEDPCYVMARQVFAATGAAAIPVDVDARGMIVSRLEGLEAQLAYVTPSHQYPLGGVMPLQRRQALLNWAEAVNAYVVEDDYDGEYRYDIKPVPPLHTLGEAGRVIYIGTFSKTLSPTLRLGYMVVPSALHFAFAKAKELTDRHSSLIDQEALASLLQDGTYERHVRRMRRFNGERRAFLLDALARRLGDQVQVEGAEAGLHVVLWVKHVSAQQEEHLIDTARTMGLAVYPLGPSYAGERPDCAGLIMGYSGLDQAEITTGVDLFAAALGVVSG